MKEYRNAIEQVLKYGVNIGDDRTGTGTKSVFGYQGRYSFKDGFPIQTARKTSLITIFHELNWFLRGSTDNNELNANNVTIWDEWALDESDVRINWFKMNLYLKPSVAKFKGIKRKYDAYQGSDYDFCKKMDIPAPLVMDFLPGALGPIYGKQWRDFNGVDQFELLIKNLRDYPYSRRHLVSAWNPEVIPTESLSPQENIIAGNSALPPCHAFFQFNVTPPAVEGGKKGISILFYCRSQDLILGAPYNIASYAMLLMIVAHMLDYEPLDVVHTCGNMHIYNNHLNKLDELLSLPLYDRPVIRIRDGLEPRKNPEDYEWGDFEFVTEYKHGPVMKFPISV